MDWIQFVGFLSVPLGGAVWFGIKQALAAKTDLAAFKVEVAKSYASLKAMEKLEARIMTELEKIDHKIEKLLDPR